MERSNLELYRDYESAGNVTFEQKKYDESLGWFSKLLDLEDDFPEDDVHRCLMHQNLAAVYIELEQFEKAEEHSLKAQAWYENYLSADQVDGFIILKQNIYSNYVQTGREEEAVKICQSVLSLCDEYLSKDDVRRVWALKSIGINHKNDHDFVNAEKYFRLALEVLDSAGDEGVDERASVLKHLAILFCNQGRYIESLEHLKRSIDLTARKTKDEKDLYFEALMIKAGVCLEAGLSPQAKKLFLEVKEHFEKDENDYYSRFHLPVLYTNIGTIAQIDGDYEEAEKMIRKAMVLSKNYPAEQRKSKVSMSNSLARHLHSIGKYSKAESVYVETIAKWEELAEDEFERLSIQDGYVDLLVTLGHYDKARKLLEPLLRQCQNKYGPLSATTINLVCLQAYLERENGNLKNSSETYRKALHSAKASTGKASRLTAHVKLNLSEVELGLGNLEEAKDFCKDGLPILKEKSGKTNAVFLNGITQSARLMIAEGDLDEAEQVLKDVLRIMSKQFGDDNILNTKSLHLLGGVHLKQGNLIKAEERLGKAVDIRSRVLGNSHLKTLSSKNSQASLRAKQKRYDEAADLLKSVLAGRQALLGQEHGQVEKTRASLVRTLKKAGLEEEAEAYSKQVAESKS